VVRRVPTKREVRRALAARTAAEAIGPITHACEIYGLSKGQFSLVDIMLHCLAATGPADVVCSTWTAAGADIDYAFRLLTDGTIRSLQFIVDFSFPSRQPAYCAALRERFGDAAVRVTKNHAKFVTIRNAGWSVVIRSSMNLNENRRLENFEISDDAALADYLAGVVAGLFEYQQPGEGFTKRPFEVCKDFERFGEDGAPVDEAAIMASTDTKKYFGSGPFDNDLRRMGLTYSKGESA
jgi:hypothetical protein